MMAPIKTRTTLYPTPTIKRNYRSHSADKKNETVGVYLRLRPIKIEPSLVKIDAQRVETVPPDGTNKQIYTFNQVFDCEPQNEIFTRVARPVVDEFVKNGKDGLIFTYGITGSGKTYTMEGLKTDPGLIYRTIDYLFNSFGAQLTTKGLIESDGSNGYRVQEERSLYPLLGVSEDLPTMPSVVKWQNRTKETSSVAVDPLANYALFITLTELYNKQVHDLFEDFSNVKEKKRREIRSDQRGINYVANATEIEVRSAEEAVEYYTRGVKRRKIGSTALNQESSRGHCVFSLKLVRIHKSYGGRFNADTLVTSQLCLVDLAGSERAKRSGATGGALHEACNINNSLGALRKCIRALRDREPTNIQYRDYTLTRLFKNYFEGKGAVRMILCVKPSAQDFDENNMAMEFGVLTQDVAVDYASPTKLPKRSKSRAQECANYAIMYDYFGKKLSHYEPNPEVSDEVFIEDWIGKLKSNREMRLKYIDTSLAAQAEVRQNILRTFNEITSLGQLNEKMAEDLKKRQVHVTQLETNLQEESKRSERALRQAQQTTNERQKLVDDLKSTRKALQRVSHQKSEYEKLCRDSVSLMDHESRLAREELIERMIELQGSAPSAPVEQIRSSSPIKHLNPSNSDITETVTPPTTTNTSSEAVESQEHTGHIATRSQFKNLLSSPTHGGIPVVNPKHNRSLSCSSMLWIHHKPAGTIDMGTVLKPKLKNGRSVKNLRSSDILRKDATGYSVVHQDADSNGDVETSVYKGQIITTVCGGKQVILDDVETMKQVSPKRKRISKDAHYTH